MAPGEFFEERRAAAVLKHGLVGRYVHIFASKTGVSVPGGRVVYLDGYAGPGIYKDGSPGSPMLAAQSAEKLQASYRNLVGFYVEEDPDTAAELGKVLAGTKQEHRIFVGSLADRIDECLAAAGSSPMFAFFDPFGLAVDFTVLQRVLTRSAPTEILVNFTDAGLRRNAGHLDAQSDHAPYMKAKPKLIENTNRTMGGDWWQAMWRSNTPDRKSLIVDEYIRRLAATPGTHGTFRVPASNRWQGPAVYDLIFISQHRDGTWAFHEALSSAMQDFYAFCQRAEREKGELELFPYSFREEQWVKEITANLERGLQQGPVHILRDLVAVFGSSLGWAREKHLRKAIKALFKLGKTRTNGVGDLQRVVVHPP